MKVTILGMGEIGTALYSILKEKKNVTVRGWDKNSSKIPGQGTLEESLEGSEVVFLCVPSWTLRGALHGISALVPRDACVVSLAKGIEKETCKTTDELLKEYLPEHHVGVLGGPMIAEEMLAGKHAAGVLGTEFPEARKRIKHLFKKTRLHIAVTSDMRGVALCGVLKNAYSLIIGMSEGLNVGQNAKGAFMAGAVTEMRYAVKLLGGKDRTVHGLAGIGDLFATSTSPNSRNRTVGVALATDGHESIASEGLMSLHCLEKLLTNERDTCPLLFFLIDLMAKRTTPSSLITYLSSLKI